MIEGLETFRIHLFLANFEGKRTVQCGINLKSRQIASNRNKLNLSQFRLLNDALQLEIWMASSEYESGFRASNRGLQPS